MWVSVAAFLFLAFMLVLVAVSGPAGAATAVAPDTVVLNVDRVVFYETGGGDQYQSFSTVNWRLSANDPDQVNGSWDYRIHLSNDGGNLSFIPAPAPIVGRPGWVSAFLEFIEPVENASKRVSVSANDTGDPQGWSGYSCGFNVELDVNRTHYQCGAIIEPPTGVSGLVVAPFTETTPGGEVLIRVGLSPDDPDQEQGDFEYWIGTSKFPYNATFSLDEDPTGAEDADGVRNYTRVAPTMPAGTSYKLYVKAQARDPLTLEHSQYSCMIDFQEGIQFDGASCGSLGRPNVGPAPGEPAYPFVDLPMLEDAVGFDADILHGMLAAMTVLGVAFVGYAAASGPGAVAAGVIGIGFVVALGLFPVWAVVVLFMVAVGVIVFKFKGGGDA